MQKWKMWHKYNRYLLTLYMAYCVDDSVLLAVAHVVKVKVKADI